MLIKYKKRAVASPDLSVWNLRDSEKKEPAASYSRTGESRTTLGDEALDFSVRNGNWYDNLSMATGVKALR